MQALGNTLSVRFGRSGWAVAIGLVVALVFQILALTMPFIEFSIFLGGDTTYGLLSSIRLLWQSDLHVIALLIVSFSVVFPFLKLVGLWTAWFVLPRGDSRTKLIRILGVLGKWSMMDPFCVTVLVALSSGQWAVSAITHIGIYFFLAAVTLSMTLSLVIMHLDRATQTPNEPRSTSQLRIAERGGVAAVFVPLAFLVSAAAVLFAIDLPFVQVDQFLLNSNSIGIAGFSIDLLKNHQWALGVLSCVGLIIVPAGTLICELWFWFSRATPAGHQRRRRVMDAIYEWSMMDVFGLSLVLILLEGDRFVKAELRSGLWFIAAAVIVAQLARKIAQRAVAASLRKRANAG